MKKNRTFPVLLFVLAILLVLTQKGIAVGASMSNPVHVSTREDAERAAGQLLPSLPENVSDVVYSYIDAPADEPNGTVIAQAAFQWEGTKCTLRVASATEIRDIAGFYYTWTFERSMRVGTYDGLIRLMQDGPGVALWYDVRNGAACSLSMDDNASLDRLMNLCICFAEWEQEEPPPLPGGEYSDSRILSQLGFAEPSNAAEINKALGQKLDIPEGAVEITYYIYPHSADDGAPAAIRYTYAAQEYVLFAQRGSEAWEPSGIAVPWTKWEAMSRYNIQFVMCFDPDKEGLITWFDQDKGVNFTVGMTDHASTDALITMAEHIVNKQ